MTACNEQFVSKHTKQVSKSKQRVLIVIWKPQQCYIWYVNSKTYILNVCLNMLSERQNVMHNRQQIALLAFQNHQKWHTIRDRNDVITANPRNSELCSTVKNYETGHYQTKHTTCLMVPTRKSHGSSCCSSGKELLYNSFSSLNLSCMKCSCRLNQQPVAMQLHRVSKKTVPTYLLP